MTEPLLWLMSIEALGVLMFPLVFRVFSMLPDRGWLLAKPIALAIVSYGFWYLGLSTIVDNSIWSVFGVIFVIGIGSAVLGYRDWRAIAKFFTLEWRVIAVGEILFVAVFAIWLTIRASIPEISHTEQPMDWMILNSIVASSTFPPADSWLSGESVSYYYFGYLIMGTLTILTNIETSITYNLSLATIAANAAVGAFGITFCLVRLNGGSRISGSLAGLASAILLVGASNLAGSLFLLQAIGIGTSWFWSWVGLPDIAAGAGNGSSWMPTAGWWWWQVSRIIPGGIVEFPAFSLILGDLHPHLMGVPYVLVTLGIAVQVAIYPGLLEIRNLKTNWPTFFFASWILGILGTINTWDFPLGACLLIGAISLNAIRYGTFGKIAISFKKRMIGWSLIIFLLGLGILMFFYRGNEFISLIGTGIDLKFNYLLIVSFLLLAIGIVMILPRTPFSVVCLSAGLIVFSMILYGPFYITFEGNASGIYPLRGILTRPVHLLLIWGLSGFWVLTLLMALWGSDVLRAVGWDRRLLIAAAIVFAPIVIWLQPVWGILAYAGVLLAIWAHVLGFRWAGVDEAPLAIGSGTSRILLLLVLVSLLTYDGLMHGEQGELGKHLALGRLSIVIPMALMGTIALFASWGFAHALREPSSSGGVSLTANELHRAHLGLSPILGIIGIAVGLIMGVELFHVGDAFGGELRRMNTVFKLYYQSWILLSIVGGFSLFYVADKWDLGRVSHRISFVTWAGIIVIGFGLVSYFAVGATWSRVSGTSNLSLDGQAHILYSEPGELEAINWIKRNLPKGVVVLEAAVVPCSGSQSGCSDWTNVGRIAGSTGRPTILGWEQHEYQWRRHPNSIAERKSDISEIYTSQNVPAVMELMKKYDVQYVIVGQREIAAYGIDGMTKFTDMGLEVFSIDFHGRTTKIYRVH